MFPPKPGRAARADTTGRWGLLIEQARDDAQRDISPQDGDRLFYQRSVPKRIVVMMGGPLMNLVLAVVLLTMLVSVFGIKRETTLTLEKVSACVIPADAPVGRTCLPSDPRAPGAAAGLRPGDTVVSFAGKPLSSWEEIRTAIRANPGRSVPMEVDRAGSRLSLTVTPVVDRRPVLGGDGQARRGADGKLVLEPVGFLGLEPRDVRVTEPVSAVPAVVGNALARTAGVVLRIPEKMVGVVQAAFAGGERDVEGPSSVVGVARFGGEIASLDSETVGDKLVGLLGLLAALNLALFVFNMIPLLPLDGGHIAGALWEGLRRQVARMRDRPDPGPVDVARALPVAYAVASVLLVMSVLLIYADLVNPIRLIG
jgi:membrane-associated protease RseP (regulator of RpoE activity)